MTLFFPTLKATKRDQFKRHRQRAGGWGTLMTNPYSKRPRTRRLYFEDGLMKTPSETSLDTTLSRSEWSRPAKLSQAACRLLKVGGDRVSAEGWTVVRQQCAI